jgi:SAM-dependent methyltransferase
MLKQKKCPVCESQNIFFHSKYRNKNEVFKNLTKFSCSDCNLVFSLPMPGQDKLNQYNLGYHQNAHGGHKRDKKLEAFFSGIAKCRLHTLENNISINSDDKFKVLEIGPGPGVFAKVWLNKYHDTEYHAIETDSSVHNQLLNLGIKIIQESNFESIKPSYDLIIISHVLEHVTKPRKFLSRFTDKLKKDGHLFIEVPCRDWDHKEMDEPHLLFFEKNTFIKLIKKINLEKVFIGYFGTEIKKLKNPLFKFFNKVKQKLFYYNINIYNSQRKTLYKILDSKLETNATINHSPHIEQISPSWWLRVIIKK